MDRIQLPSLAADPRASRIHRRLGHLGQGPAANFLDAYRLVGASPPLPTTTHLVAHLLREIESALRDVAEPPEGSQPPARPAGRQGTGNAAKGEDKHIAGIRRVLAWLEIDSAGGVAENWLGLTGQGNPDGLARRAHRDNLNLPRPLDEDFRRWWDRLLGILDAVLERLEARYGDVFARIGALVAAGPTKATAGKIALQVPTSFVAHQHLFSSIEGLGQARAAEWLVPLREAGLFRYPPPPELDDAGEIRGYAAWPQAHYLAAVAAERPSEVREIIAGVATENLVARRQLVDAAAALSPAAASDVAPLMAAWASSLLPDFGAPELVRFASRLAERDAPEGAADQALALLRRLVGLPGAGDAGETPPRQRLREMPLYLPDTLDRLVPVLARHKPLDTLEILAEALAADLKEDLDATRALFEPHLREMVEVGAESARSPRGAAHEAAPASAGDVSWDTPLEPASAGGVNDDVGDDDGDNDQGGDGEGDGIGHQGPGPGPHEPRGWRYDGSAIRIPALADASAIRMRDLPADDPWELLVYGVRDAAAEALWSGVAPVRQVVEVLRHAGGSRPPFMVFGRLILHLIAGKPEDDPSLTAEWLLRRDVYDRYDMRPEYDRLLAAGYRILDRDDRERLLGWLLEGGPEPRRRDLTPEERQDVLDGRLRDRLAPLRGQLPSHLEERLAELTARLDARSEVRRHTASVDETSDGFHSPKTADELTAISPDELVGLLADWATPTDPGLEPPVGLAFELQRAVAARPDHFAEHAPAVGATHPRFAAALADGLGQAVPGARVLPWPPILEFCRATVRAARARPGASQPDHRQTLPEGHEQVAPQELPAQASAAGAPTDSGEEWLHAQRAVAALLRTALDAAGREPAVLPFAEHDRVWKVLEELLVPAGRPESAAGMQTPPEDVRAVAVEAAIAYVWWVRKARTAPPTPDGADAGTPASGPWPGLDAVPGAARVIETYLDWSLAPYPSVRRALGRRIAQLVALDREWTAARVAVLFPRAPQLAHVRDLTWAAYVATDPYVDVYRLLAAEYSESIARLRQDVAVGGQGAESTGEGPADPGGEDRVTAEESAREAVALGKHLAAFCWRGAFELTDPGHPLDAYFDAAGAEPRARVLNYVGRSLHAWKPPHDPDILARVRRLWDWWAERSRGAGAAGRYQPGGGRRERHELEEFGWWFTSRRLEPEWALPRLRDLLGLTGWVEPDGQVAALLSELTPSFPDLVVRCVELIDPDVDEMSVRFTWRRHAAEILRAVRASDSEDAAKVAREVAGRWVARGYTDLLEFATADPPPPLHDRTDGPPAR